MPPLAGLCRNIAIGFGMEELHCILIKSGPIERPS